MGFNRAGLEDTIEIFGGQNYESEWKVVDSVRLGTVQLRQIVFPLVGEDVLRPPGGVFMGLIKYKSDDIRPTFLSQTNFSSIKLDLPGQILELTSETLISPETDAVPLLDLRKAGNLIHWVCTNYAWILFIDPTLFIIQRLQSHQEIQYATILLV